MDYFKINKYQLVEENIPYTAKVLYELLDKKKHVDQLFEDFSKTNNIQLSINVEKVLFLSLTFLFALGKVKVEKDLLVRD